jgi:CRP/FNR family cyclic AMP-dependent transcriptional regulator
LQTALESVVPQGLLSRLPPKFSGKLMGEKTVSLRRGEMLFERGDPGDGCYWLQRGVLAVCVGSAAGEHRILAILGPGAIVGELAMIDGLPRSASVQAVRDCQLTFVSRSAFRAMLQDHPEIYADLVSTLAARLRQSDEEMLASSFLSVRARVARALLQFASQLGEEIEPGRLLIQHRVTHNDLAAMAGVARESVSRTLSTWQRQKIVQRPSRRGYVVHKSRLEVEAKPAL